jgi:hypothetical protein
MNNGSLRFDENNRESAERPSKKNLSCRVVRVGPALAAHWLKRNHPNNRRINQGQVAAFVADMQALKWILTHQGIAFDANGNLIDGQHRLHAIVQSGVEIDLLVVNNPEGDYQSPIDFGWKRNIATVQNWSTREVAAIGALRSLEQGYGANAKLTLAEAVEIHSHHADSLRECTRERTTGGLIAACVWAYPCAPGPTLEFLAKVCSGEMIGRGHPAWAYREWKRRNARIGTWDHAKAALNCLRFVANGLPMRGVFTGEMGYRAFTAQRRKLKVPYTPSAETVPGQNWVPAKGESQQ